MLQLNRALGTGGGEAGGSSVTLPCGQRRAAKAGGVRVWMRDGKGRNQSLKAKGTNSAVPHGGKHSKEPFGTFITGQEYFILLFY